MLAGLALVAGQLGWTAALLAHSYFRQGDFGLLDRALAEPLGWDYLMRLDGGHLMPAGLALIWSLARNSRYDWLPAAGVVMVLVAAASLALLRLLVTLFGRPGDDPGPARPGILVPFAVYLFGPLSAGAVAWLSVAVRVLPLQLAMFLAIGAHVRYVRRGRLRSLIAAAAWLALGMAAANQGALVPVLLFALTAAFFVPGRLPDAARRAAAGYWRAWALYGALLAAYCVIFFLRLAGSGLPVPGPGQASSLYRFAGTLLGTAALPGFAGGPWRWLATGYGQASPPGALEAFAWLLVALVVAASCYLRPNAWRAWVILLGWIVLADIAPVAIHGFGGSVTALGQQTGYLANATGVLALCLGFAFMDPAGQAGPARQVARLGPRAVRVVTVFACCCFAAGTIASLQAFTSATMAAAARAYVATARAALARAPHGTVVVDGVTPGTVMDPAFFPGQASTAQVIGPLAGRGGAAGRVRWVSALNGVYAEPMIFDTKGRLRPVTVTGLRATPRRPARGTPAKGTPACWNVTGSALTSIPLGGTLYRWPWTFRVEYSGPAGLLILRFGSGESRGVILPGGTHLAYVQLTGSGSAVSAQFYVADGTRPLCVTRVVAGLVNPDPGGRAIPAAPVQG